MASQVRSKVTQDMLYESCREVTRKNGLVDFIYEVRGSENHMSGKESIKQADLDNLFSKKVWKEHDKAGHRKLTNEITGVVVEYANHSKAIDTKAVVTIVQQLQTHVNILHNDIFKMSKRGWPDDLSELDYKAALSRLNQVASTRSRSSSAP
jgi:hypothetical protein